MTTIAELIGEVRTLELEVRKLELENRLTQLKAEQLIDDACVGCAGPCEVVAAKLHEKLDECSIKTVEIDRLHKIIEELKDTTIEEVYELFCIHEEELSACSEDSKVLMRVVEIVKRDDRCSVIMYQLVDTLVDYLDAPEELDIDGHQDISITVALLERL